MSTFYEKYQGNFIHLADFKQYFKKKRALIVTTGIFCAFLTLALFLTTNPKYVLKGSFKEALQKSESLSQSIVKSIFSGSSSSDLGAQALSVMQTRESLTKLVDKLALQGEIKPASVYENVKQRWVKNLKLIAKKSFSSTPTLSFTKVMYLGEVPKVLLFELGQGGVAHVFADNGALLCTQNIKEIFTFDDLIFSITALDETRAIGQRVKLVFSPLETTVDEVQKRLAIKVRRDDPSILDITYKDANPYRGAKALNTLMHEYKHYLEKENERIADAQLQYLSARQEMLSSKIEETLEEHVKYLQENLGEKGFVGLHQELEIVESKKREQNRRLLEIDLSMSRLSRLQNDRLLCLNEPILGESVSSFQNKLFGLKKQKDTLDLSTLMRSASKQREKKKGSAPFLRYARTNQSALDLMQNKEQIDKDLHEAHLLPLFSMMKRGLYELYQTKDLLETEKAIDFGFEEREKELLNITKLKSQIKQMLQHPKESLEKVEMAALHEAKNDESGSFVTKTLLRIDELLTLKEEILCKNIFAEKQVPEEFTTLDLESAKSLHLEYTKELDETALEEKRLEYAKKSIFKPGFELSSLTTVLQDSISQEFLQRAAVISQNLKNKHHFSEKDMKRLNAGLQREKKGLCSHVNEMIYLVKMQKELLGSKMASLHSVMTSLVNQEIAILENQISTSIEEKLSTLSQEKEAVKAKLSQIQKEMKDLPRKWLLENRLQLKSDLNVGMMEAISQLVESKNVEHHLMQIESKPIDHAYVPLKPKHPPTLLLSTAGGIFGSLLMMGFLAFRKVSKNELPVSLEAMRFRDCSVAGVLSKQFERADFSSLCEEDLQTLRQLTTFTVSSKQVIVGACLGNKSNYLSALASLLALSKRKTIVIEMFHHTKHTRSGLLHYLLGKRRELPIQKKGDFHLLTLGESTKYTMELLTRKKFAALLEALKEQYDVILIGLDKSAKTAEGIKLTQLCDKMLITLDEESLDHLYPYLEWEEKKQQRCVMYLRYE